MDSEFWQQRWREGRTGFHEGMPNRLLVQFGKQALGSPERVLVPLCGKSVDLAYLAAGGSKVVGVELVEDAVRAFFAEQHIAPSAQTQGPFVRYGSDKVELFCGDFFAATVEELGRFAAVYDRAALIALPQDLRVRYAAHLRHLLEPRARLFLVTLEHDLGGGPPFSVPEAEVRALWAGCTITRLADEEAQSAALAARGAKLMREQAWCIEVG